MSKKRVFNVFIVILICANLFPISVSAKSHAAHSASHRTTSHSHSVSENGAESAKSKESAETTNSKVNLEKSKTVESITKNKIAKNNYEEYTNTQSYNNYLGNYYGNSRCFYYGVGVNNNGFLNNYYLYRTLSPYQRVYCYNTADYQGTNFFTVVILVIIFAAFLIIIFIIIRKRIIS